MQRYNRADRFLRTAEAYSNGGGKSEQPVQARSRFVFVKHPAAEDLQQAARSFCDTTSLFGILRDKCKRARDFIENALGDHVSVGLYTASCT